MKPRKTLAEAIREAWYQYRCYRAEMYLDRALNIVPKDSDEELGLLLAIKAYHSHITTAKGRRKAP